MDIQYCPSDSPLPIIWIDHGISQCFLSTVSVSITAGFLLLFGAIQLYFYRKHATRIDTEEVGQSKLFNLQIFLLIFIQILGVIRFILEAFYFDGAKIYGFMVSGLIYEKQY